ncbi:hypothetical protein [Halobacterium yunchengense]|uniref:DUF7835 family putative zinc beta-ribbon protein n=1 Tax=Halobacterium yunchengense TaxID=3108497 RepID=UPI00300BCA4D
MATKTPMSNLTEFCEDCDRETRHAVEIQLRVENAEASQPKCSREPYRVSECLHCEATDAVRMNDA